MMKKFVITAKLGDDYCNSIIVEATDIQDAVREAAYQLNCMYSDIVCATIAP